MKLLFLCGSLEQGRDGVGDYTQRLAAELVRQGHQVTAIALHDQYLDHLYEGDATRDGVIFPVLRINASASRQFQLEMTNQWIDKHDPEWVSLQFVPFAFDSKGLPFYLSKFLKRLGKGRLWHIMFHELWVGTESNATLKHLLWASLQKRLIRVLVNNLQPTAIHTQSRVYQMLLEKLGVFSKNLPLFSNIPVSNTASNRMTLDNVSEIVFVIFGGIHAHAPVEELATEAANYASRKNVEITLKIVGRTGKEQEHWKMVWKKAGLSVREIGEQPIERISEELTHAAIGIATTPFCLIDKSGSVVAMLEHGLPVICVSKQWDVKGFRRDELTSKALEYRAGNFEKIFSYQATKTDSCNLSRVAEQFLHDLLMTP